MMKPRTALGGATLVALLALLLLRPASAFAATIPIDLYAVAGSTTLPNGQTVPVWGYSLTSGGPIVAPGGPVLVATVGDTISITLHNELSVATSLIIPGLPGAPDLTGAAPAGTASYSFTADLPGTYLYEASPLTGGVGTQYQVGMGLYGALIVRPATASQAYDSASTAFDTESVLVLSEIDPALNNAADPAAFDMRDFNPRFGLINGKSSPDTDAIAAAAGTKLLLRYVNAGINYHSMALLGADQKVIALDGNLLDLSRTYAADTFGPGQATDVLVTLPNANVSLPVYDASLTLHNSNAAGMGGMMTLINVTGAASGPDVGPVATDVAFSSGQLTATLDETSTGNAAIAAAEYFLNTPGAAGSGTPLLADDGTFDTSIEVGRASVGILAGPNVLYVRGQDANGNWGALNSVIVNGYDPDAPTTSAGVLTPSVTNGSVDIDVQATADDSATGGQNIAAAELYIDNGPGVGSPMSLTTSPTAPIASVNGTIPAATVAALSEGEHFVLIRSQDSAGNWGIPLQLVLVVDKTGPGASAVSVAPNPNNGTLPFIKDLGSIRLFATVSDPISTSVHSNVAAAEAFVDSVGSDGTGIVMLPLDGSFNSPTEEAYTDIWLSFVGQLSDGDHTIYVHARDAAGNWGPMNTTILTIDKVAPSVSAVLATPNPADGSVLVNLTATATEAGTGVAAAEWFVGADPGAGNGNAMSIGGSNPTWSLSASIDVNSLANGTYTIYVRARDAAGNWSLKAPTSLTVNVPAPLFSLAFSTFGNGAVPGVAGKPDNADIYGFSGNTFSRLADASGAGSLGLLGVANIDGFSRVDATHFYVSFSNKTLNVSGLGLVQDEDVLFYNAGTWSLFFDGTAHGLTTDAHDIDAIEVDGSTLYFSTTGNAALPGLAGSGDAADIYSWNGSSFSRAIDARGAGSLGLSKTNVDGFSRIDATHFFLSFKTNTKISGLGTVQDEDIVYYSNGIWSIVFDGTTKGLTLASQDIDDFDTY